MKLASLLQPKLIQCGAAASDYEEAKELLLAMLEENEGVAAAPLRDALREREALASTVIAPGIAFPHARTDHVEDFYILIGTFPAGVEAPGAEAPVRLIVAYLLPEGASNLYLRCVSSMARFLGAEGNLDKLVYAEDPAALMQLIDGAGVLVKDVVTAQDIMEKSVVTCSADATLREVADQMVMHRTMFVAVQDERGQYQGIVTAHALLKIGIPDYFMSMETVAFLREFEPFQELLKKEQSMTVREIIDTDATVFLAHTPMIVVASKLVREKLAYAPVIDETGMLIGHISGLEFVHKVVRA